MLMGVTLEHLIIENILGLSETVKEISPYH